VIEAVGHPVFRNVAIDQKDFPVLGVGIGFRNGRLTGTQRLYLAAHENDAGFDRRLDRIGVTCLAIVGDNLLIW